MLVIEETYLQRSFYNLLPEYKEEEILFVDIETTGFSPKTTQLYMIGCMHRQENGWHLVQWFKNLLDDADEEAVLKAFCQYVESFKAIVTFNGKTFDIPYLQKKMAVYEIHLDDQRFEYLDIYEKIKPYRQFFELENLKQKSVEAFLGYGRKDIYSGRELISVYKKYLKSQAEDAKDILLLHNREDILYLGRIAEILEYPEIFHGRFEVVDARLDDDVCCIRLRSYQAVPVPIIRTYKEFELRMQNCDVILRCPLGMDGELRYYYEDYKNYDYIPSEDMAIHKRMSGYIDKALRVKASKDNCYSKFYAAEEFLNSKDKILKYAAMLLKKI